MPTAPLSGPRLTRNGHLASIDAPFADTLYFKDEWYFQMQWITSTRQILLGKGS
jgi:hypothetical protein